MNRRMMAGTLVFGASLCLGIHFLLKSVCARVGIQSDWPWQMEDLEWLWIRRGLLSWQFWLTASAGGTGIWFFHRGVQEEKQRQRNREKDILDAVRRGQMGTEYISQEIWRLRQAETLACSEAQEAAAFQKRIMENAAHQIRSTLFSCQMNCELLQERLQDEDLDRLEQGLRHCESISDQFLKASVAWNRYHPFHFRKTQITRLLQDLPEDVRIRIAGDVSPFYLDPLWMKEALLALIQNAREHGTGDMPVKVLLQEESGICIVKIVNQTDSSMDPVIFRRYQTAGEGHYGIGLDLAREVVEGHHGSLSACCFGDRAEFTVKLPVLELERHRKEKEKEGEDTCRQSPDCSRSARTMETDRS